MKVFKDATFQCTTCGEDLPYTPTSSLSLVVDSGCAFIRHPGRGRTGEGNGAKACPHQNKLFCVPVEILELEESTT